MDSFFYAITNDEGQLEEVHLIQQSEEIDLKKYPKLRSTKIALANRYYTLIPEADYNEHSLEDYVYQVLGSSPRHQYVFQADHVQAAGLYVCYAIPKSLYQYCFKLPSIPIIYHQVGTLLPLVKPEDTRSVIHVSRYQDLIIIIAFVNGRLHIANTFVSLSPITTLYYISLIQKNIGVKKRDVDIEFSGAFIRGDETERLLSRYYNNLSYRSSSLKLDDQLLENSSLYYPLQSVYLCG